MTPVPRGPEPPDRFEYTEEEWDEAAGHRPLRDVEFSQLLLLHRHWIWSDRERDSFYSQLKDGQVARPDRLAADVVRTMFLWYALTWSLIEGFNDRDIELRGRFAEDIEAVSEGLRQFRNAVFHISRDSYFDARLFRFMDEELPCRMGRISSGFGRLLTEELQAREARPEGE